MTGEPSPRATRAIVKRVNNYSRLPRLGPHPAQTDTATDIAADARASLGQLITAWGWLAALRAPGRPGPRPTRPTSTLADVDRRAAAAAIYRDDRRAALTAAAAGNKPTGAHTTPVRLDIVAARVHIASEVTALAARMWEAVYGCGLLTILRDPAARDTACTWCHGLGQLDPPLGWAPWAWPADPVLCPRCNGRGRIPVATTCPACHAQGPCDCDRTDLAVALHLDAVDELLDVADTELAADADYTLATLNGYAEHAAGVGKDRRRVPGAECPVCGARELIAEVSDADPRRWSITCTGPDCICAGPGCDCGIGTDRRKDRRHRWPAATWDSRSGLAAAVRAVEQLPGVLASISRMALNLTNRNR